MRSERDPNVARWRRVRQPGLEAIDSNRYRDVFTITLNAGGVFVTGKYGSVPLIRDLARANSLLYRQSTGLRTRWMVERFKAWESTPAGDEPPKGARQGVLFGLATTFDSANNTRKMSDAYEAFVAKYPEHRTFDNKDLAFVPTVFDRLDSDLVDALVYRGWWLTGAALAQFHPDQFPIRDDVQPPNVAEPLPRFLR